MSNWKIFLAFLVAGGLAAIAQTSNTDQPKSNHKDSQQLAGQAPADISGMYTFLQEGEFLQINLEEDRVTGYISRMGDQESDRGSFLDQFFEKASIQDRDVSFTTKVLHGTWFEFKGRVERGKGRSKAEDGYFVLRGTLTEFSGTGDQKAATARSRQVEFKWMAQPPDDEDSPKPPKKK